MKRLLPAIAGLLMLARPAGPAELTPRDYYTAIFTGLGAAGGTALGLSLAGISRFPGSADTGAYTRWGALGAAFGAILGHEIGDTSIDAPSDIVGRRPVSTRESNACLGALAGQLAGLGLAAILTKPVNGDNKDVWSAIALGTFAGAAAAWFLPPVPFITLPPDRSERQSAVEREASRLEAGPGTSGEAGTYTSKTESLPIQQVPPDRPALPASKQGKLNMLLLTPENDRLLQSSRPVFPAEKPGPAAILPPMGGSGAPAPAGAAVVLGALAGGLLGATAGAALPGPDRDMLARIGVGGGAGLLGGWALSVLLTDQEGENEAREAGRMVSITSAGGLVGGVLGIATGAVMMNSRKNFKPIGVGQASLIGTGAGLLAGLVCASASQ